MPGLPILLGLGLAFLFTRSRGRTVKLSPNFALSEFTASNTATKYGISNEPTSAHLANLRALATDVLEPLREKSGRPIRISSGYRSAELNEQLAKINPGVSKTSQHMKGQAADLQLYKGDSVAELLPHLEGLDFDQLIIYGYKPHLHISYRADGRNRRQFLFTPLPGSYLPVQLSRRFVQAGFGHVLG